MEMSNEEFCRSVHYKFPAEKSIEKAIEMWRFLDGSLTTKKFLCISPLKWPAIFFLWLYTAYFVLCLHLTIDKKFLCIFPLKWPAIFFLWLYTAYFVLCLHLTIDDLLEAGFDFHLFTSYIRFAKCFLSFISVVVFLLASVRPGRTPADPATVLFIFCFILICLYRIISTALFTTREICILRLPYIYLEAMYNFCGSVEEKHIRMKYTHIYWYLCCFIFNVTLILGWYIIKVLYSYYEEMWIPPNLASEGTVADMHIVPVAEKPADSGASSHKWKETKKKSNKGSKNKSKTKSNRKHGRRR